MPIARVPFGQWTPDRGEWEHEGLYKVQGAVHSGGKWVPSPGFISVEDCESGSPAITDLRGLWLHNPNTGTEDLYIGYGHTDKIRIASIASGTTFDAGSSVTATADTTSGCQMTSYGNYIYYATGQANDIARGTHNSMSTGVVVYTTPDSYRPRPRYIATIKNHLLIANMKIANAPAGAPLATATSYPELVMWSATDNPLRFGDPSSTPSATLLGADYQQLYDEHGPITGLIGGDYAYIFKANSIWRMDGPPWQFRPVVVGSGCIYPNSIVQLHEYVYYWGPGGPTRLRQGDSAPLAPGTAKYTSTLTDGVSVELQDYLLELQPTLLTSPSAAIQPIDISAVVDHRNGLVAWSVGETAVTTGTTLFRDTFFVVYDTHTDSLSSFKVNGKLRFCRSAPRVGTQSHTRIWGGSTAMAHNVLDGTFAVGSIGSLAAGVHTAATTATASKILVSYGDSTSSSFEYGTFPTQWAPQFIWAYRTFGDPPAVSRIRRVRVPFSLDRGGTKPGDGDPDGKLIITVKVRSKSRLVDAYHESTGTYDSSSTTWQNPDWWIDIDSPIEATHHQLEVKFECYNSVASAKRWISYLRDLTYIEVEFIGGGESGTAYLT